MSDVVAQAVRELVRSQPQTQIMRVGTVTSTSPLEVTLAGGTTLSAARLAAYTATLSDTVLILQTETDLIILGKIISGG